MRSHRLRDADGTPYDPETGERVAAIEALRPDSFRTDCARMVMEMLAGPCSNDDVDADHG